MSDERKMLGDILARAAAALDIPDYVYEDATLKYEDVGAWLGQDDSELGAFAPEIYPQGSFRLGTVVRPIFEADQYDIDLVCHLQITKEQTTQRNLKTIVGDRLRERDDLKKIVTPSRRCWVLDYPAEDQMPRFHMDVLPAIPNHDRPPTGILLTDTQLLLWQKSNPKAYAEWFYERMKIVLQAKRAAVAESLKASVEEVPEWQVKTPLQIAVQILKRHRDVYFQNDIEHRPASIIITTLAARSYGNQADIYDALAGIVRGMPSFIEKRGDRWWVANPVDPDENFADRWNDYPARREAFVRWLGRVQTDFSKVRQTQTLKEAVEVLRPALGERTMAKSAADLGIQLGPTVAAVAAPVVQVPGLADTAHLQRPVWPMAERYRATIAGSVHLKKGTKKLWGLTDRPVPKKIWLRFAVKTNAPAPYDLRWQVVNTGKEAAAAGQLRGDFYDSDVSGTGIRWEATAYAGTHWVEAFVIKDGTCVGKSGRRIVKVR